MSNLNPSDPLHKYQFLVFKNRANGSEHQKVFGALSQGNIVNFGCGVLFEGLLAPASHQQDADTNTGLASLA
ncbi:MAG: hypothetical protein CFE27_08755 [Alphaproteobacteria bacterium PA1]|nr:MAG: hypothetical protein CFE27_08755 [Alphaproteobacteria bacterium PA1]